MPNIYATSKDGRVLSKNTSSWSGARDATDGTSASSYFNFFCGCNTSKKSKGYKLCC